MPTSTNLSPLAAAATVLAIANADSVSDLQSPAIVNALASEPAPTAKPAKAAKPKAAKPAAKPIVPAIVPDATNDRTAERIAARTVIAAYYAGIGKSVPFKSASDTFATVRLDKQPLKPSVRQAALYAAMLLAGDNIKPDGTFTRGGFTFDGRAVQPETGCLSDGIGRTVTYVSGPLLGKQARDATFRLDLRAVRAEISALLGDKLAAAALAKLDKLGCTAPKPAKAA